MSVVASNSLEDVSIFDESFLWVSRHLERVYGEGWETEARNKDIGKEMLKLFMIEDKQGEIHD